jgi:hypothetical protein
MKKLNVFVLKFIVIWKIEVPDFNSENAKLSENFIEAVNEINETSIDSDYFKMKVQYFITELKVKATHFWFYH